MPAIARILAAALLLGGTLPSATAQNATDAANYPSHAIRMIVPFPSSTP
jgi:tripartite-type tricarboxylate transporter receptor subunit TctC